MVASLLYLILLHQKQAYVKFGFHDFLILVSVKKIAAVQGELQTTLLSYQSLGGLPQLKTLPWALNE